MPKAKWEASTHWNVAIDALKPYVVRIEAPDGRGSGFMFLRPDGDLCAIATAAHVVDSAHYWEQPIRIHNHTLDKSVLIRPSDRAIFLDKNRDTAAVVVRSDLLPFPTAPLELAPRGRSLKVGFDAGWLGFPAVAPGDLCFFSGRISAYRDPDYLVDGVAINGVSGGPGFHVTPSDDIHVIGVVTAYIANRATGETLPGLAVIADVDHLHEVVSQLRDLETAQEQESPKEPQPTSV